MTILDIPEITAWSVDPFDSLQAKAIESLESGSLILLPKLSFALQLEEQKFLSPDFVDKKAKNISFNPINQTVKGISGTSIESQQIKIMVARFACQSHQLVQTLFPHYKNALKIGRNSFRPVEVC